MQYQLAADKMLQSVYSMLLFNAPRWDATDAEIKDTSVEKFTAVKGSLF